ncbi:hypothetical protein LTR84_007417 [Exophiala bonariae]|uniref:Glycoside hydrolase 35 catalytic domain-containing protein n=1 Tax=Exophiala bonariae TaxID=1690606 RepID=A0AAV9N1X0_9EURO|nr:hypothetical protein LTR84_007417 [Exophiala bonariae]
MSASHLSKNEIPHLRRTGTSAQLIVNGKPFLMLAGELHNSSLSSAAYMSTVWPVMKAMNINTLLGAITWEVIEPIEGTFDFNELDKIIVDARTAGLHLVLLWFGSFKNALSTYVPSWVKRDFKRFPRVHVRDDTGRLKTTDLISPFNKQAWEADAKAFAALMRHLREIDSGQSTVLMVQVENETGLLGDSRDRSRGATEAFKSPVPNDLLVHLQNHEELHPLFLKRWPDFQTSSKQQENKDWESVFGIGVATEELFMADTFARYVSQVAAAGRAEYELPLYTNTWLNTEDVSILDISGVPAGDGKPTVAGGGTRPGAYPSGGPVPHLLDIWNFHTVGKGNLDFISPDIYLQDYSWICHQYRHQSNPLFIPEQKADLAGVRRIWLAYGSHQALGCSLFGIDTVFMNAKEQEAWTRSNGLLKSMSGHILHTQAERPDSMFGFFFDDYNGDKPHVDEWHKKFKDIDIEVTVERSFVFGKPEPGYGIVIHTGEKKFLLIGAGFRVTFESTNAASTFTGILSAQEKTVNEEGALSTLRVLNGDETRSGAFMNMPTESPDYGGFPIRVTIPARTYIAEVTVYSIEESVDGF